MGSHVHLRKRRSEDVLVNLWPIVLSPSGYERDALQIS